MGVGNLQRDLLQFSKVGAVSKEVDHDTGLSLASVLSSSEGKVGSMETHWEVCVAG